MTIQTMPGADIHEMCYGCSTFDTSFGVDVHSLRLRLERKTIRRAYVRADQAYMGRAACHASVFDGAQSGTATQYEYTSEKCR